MTKRTKSKVKIKPVEKKTKRHNVNNNKNSYLATPHKIDDLEFVTSCISKTLEDNEKKALKKGKNFNSKGKMKVFKFFQTNYYSLYQLQNYFFIFYLFYFKLIIVYIYLKKFTNLHTFVVKFENHKFWSKNIKFYIRNKKKH